MTIVFVWMWSIRSHSSSSQCQCDPCRIRFRFGPICTTRFSTTTSHQRVNYKLSQSKLYLQVSIIWCAAVREAMERMKKKRCTTKKANTTMAMGSRCKSTRKMLVSAWWLQTCNWCLYPGFILVPVFFNLSFWQGVRSPRKSGRWEMLENSESPLVHGGSSYKCYSNGWNWNSLPEIFHILSFFFFTFFLALRPKSIHLQ